MSAPPPSSRSLLSGVLERLASLVTRRASLVLLFYVLLAAVAGWITATRWQLKTDQNDLVGADLEYNRRYLAFLEEFHDLEFMYVVIEIDGEPERAAAVADAVAAEVGALTDHVQWVFHRVPLEEMRYGILHREIVDLDQLLATLDQERESITALAGVDSLASLYGLFAGAFDLERLARFVPSADSSSRSAVGEPSSSNAALAEALGHLLAATLEGTETAIGGKSPGSLSLVDQLAAASSGSLRERGYLTIGPSTAGAAVEETFVLVEILPSKDTGTVELIREPLLAVRAALERVEAQFPGVEIGLTGRPVLQADEMITTDRDMQRATIAALIGVLVLFVAFFRRLVRPVLAVAALGVAVLLTFGVAMLVVGYLTLLSIVFAAMLVGLGIDFGIHLVARYQEELDLDGHVDGAIRRTLLTTGASIGTGAVTTAGAFLMTQFVEFQGLRELGLIAGVGVLIAFVVMVTLLPALLVLADRYQLARGPLTSVASLRLPLVERLARHPVLVLLVALVITALGALRVTGLPYDSNLLELQAQSLESVRWERRLIDETSFSTWYCALLCDSLEELRERSAQIEAARERGVVGEQESVLTYLPGSQPEKIARLALSWSALGLGDLEIAAPRAEIEVDSLAESIDRLLGQLDTLTSALLRRGDETSLASAKELYDLTDRAQGILGALDELSPESARRLGEFQTRWIGDLATLTRSLREALRPREMTPADLPRLLRTRLISRDGSRYIAYAYAQEDVWEDEPMRRYIAALREIDPDVTGAPVQVYESAWRMRDGFVHSSLYALGVVLFFLLIDLRSLRPALFAMVPLVLGLAWLIELLPWFGLSFNLANFFALPILIGCGIDGGVHMVHRFRETGSTRDVCRTTLTAVSLSFLTTMVGFGAMATANHRGVASLGLLMFWGLAVILLATMTVLPACFALVERRRRARLALRVERGGVAMDDSGAGTSS